MNTENSIARISTTLVSDGCYAPGPAGRTFRQNAGWLVGVRTYSPVVTDVAAGRDGNSGGVDGKVRAAVVRVTEWRTRSATRASGVPIGGGGCFRGRIAGVGGGRRPPILVGGGGAADARRSPPGKCMRPALTTTSHWKMCARTYWEPNGMEFSNAYFCFNSITLILHINDRTTMRAA